jgi:hypothetical protein
MGFLRSVGHDLGCVPVAKDDLVTIPYDDLQLVLACISTEQLGYVVGLRDAVKRLYRAVPLSQR